MRYTHEEGSDPNDPSAGLERSRMNGDSELMTSLSACLIVRDEEGNLENCLRSLRPWVDQICVVDTGSVDRTVAIAEELADVVVSREWDSDFSAARNASLELAEGEWILAIDADEELGPDSGPRIRAAIQADRVAWLVTVTSTDGRGGSQSTLIPRLFRNGRGIHFERPVHETITASLERLGEVELTDSGVTLLHRGYTGESIARKRVRNLMILRKRALDAPDDLYNTYKLAQALSEPEQAAEQLATFEKAHGAVEGLSAEERATYPFAPLVYEGFARCLWKRGRVERAIEVAERGLELFPDCVELLYRRGDLALGVGDLHEARTHFTAATAAADGSTPLYASDPWVRGVGPWLGLARADAAEGNLEAAAENVARALDIDPTDTTTRCTSIRVQLAATDPDGGIAELERLLKDEPEADEVRLLAGEVAHARGDVETAEDIWRAAALNGGLPGHQARCQWAILDLSRGRMDAAHEHLAKLTDRDLESSACRAVLAIATAARLEIDAAFEQSEVLNRTVPYLRQLLEAEDPSAVQAFATNAQHYDEVLPGVGDLLVPEEVSEEAPEPTPSGS